MKPELKKLLILNAPYLLFVYLFDKIGQTVRLSPGVDLSGKVLSLGEGFWLLQIHFRALLLWIY